MNRTVKLKGTNLFSKERWDVIRTLVSKVSIITLKASMLAKAYYLQEEVELTMEFYKLCFKVVTNTPVVFRGEQNQQKINAYNSLQEIFINNFGDYVDIGNYSISQILNYNAKLLETCMLNNVQFHFDRYVSLYLTKHFEDKNVRWKIKSHLLFNKECDPIYHPWIQQHKHLLIPEREVSYNEDLKIRPWLYLRYMVWICKHIETHFPGTKVLSPLVLHRSYIPRHIHIDTNALVQLFMDKENIKDFVNLYDLENNEKPKLKNKADLGKSFEKVFNRSPKNLLEDFKYQQSFWKYLCKFKDDLEGFTFGNSIKTDGCSVSLLMTKELSKNKFKSRKVKKKDNQDEFDDFKLDVDNTKFFAADPGKEDLIAITDGSDTFKYTKGELHKDTKRKMFEKRNSLQRAELIIQGSFQARSLIPGYYNIIENPTLLQYESYVLSQSTSKSCYQENFLKYVKAKVYMEESISKLYERPRFRNDKFTKYTLKQSSYDKMLNRLDKFIKNTKIKNRCYDNIVSNNVNKKDYKEIVIFYGNWGRDSNLKNSSPTPGIGLRRVIHKKFKTKTTSEHFTSQTCPCCKNRSLKNPVFLNRIVDKRHHLLCCTNCSSWWNRNWAGAYNILVKGFESLNNG